MIEALLSRLFEVSRKGAIHRFYVRRAGDLGRWGLFIHRIVRSDARETFHNHPWNGYSIIIGSYVEETPTTPKRRVFFFNRVRADGFHRVEIDRPTWTVFLHFERRGPWGFVDRDGNHVDIQLSGVDPDERTGSPWRGPDR